VSHDEHEPIPRCMVYFTYIWIVKGLWSFKHQKFRSDPIGRTCFFSRWVVQPPTRILFSPVTWNGAHQFLKQKWYAPHLIGENGGEKEQNSLLKPARFLEHVIHILWGGGNSNIFWFSPRKLGKIPILTTLLGTNISHRKALLKMIFLFPR